jgi:hypothetical protein
LFRSFEASGLSAHPHRLEPLLRALAVIATLPARLLALPMAIGAMMLRSLLAVRAARRRIAVARIDAYFGLPRRVAVGLLLARMQRPTI